MAKSEVVNSTKVFGRGHAKTALAYLQLGRIFIKIGNISQAVQSFREACIVLNEAVNSLKDESFEMQLLADTYLEAADLLHLNNQFTEEFERFCKYAS